MNLREQILQLYHDNYRGGSMKLVIIGGGNFLRFRIVNSISYDILCFKAKTRFHKDFVVR